MVRAGRQLGRRRGPLPEPPTTGGGGQPHQAGLLVAAAFGAQRPAAGVVKVAQGQQLALVRGLARSKEAGRRQPAQCQPAQAVLQHHRRAARRRQLLQECNVGDGIQRRAAGTSGLPWQPACAGWPLPAPDRSGRIPRRAPPMTQYFDVCGRWAVAEGQRSDRTLLAARQTHLQRNAKRPAMGLCRAALHGCWSTAGGPGLVTESRSPMPSLPNSTLGSSLAACGTHNYLRRAEENAGEMKERNACRNGGRARHDVHLPWRP